ncbi:iron-sulfur cluster-binding protein [Deferribacter desulfuricans SSM1]|uniref:Iron-sulfur cluster-binding protein n=1 Tax=Deferribacter desulfuricans (strain DSM 14783 / JCM 11476 / NBRC 101012 / SSM1) TaxID=639282 RepID=D3P998_DEFDS|nr:heterodisulfide reductase-related iron-sulfur binding cluster [Deferribacter desulfuricans]BAI81288.1 iron-sulfur cluster-binding protein [Deferribacter desulfuricans SSM1]
MFEATREIYWNVGHGVLIPMYLFAIIAIGILVYGFKKRLELYKIGRPLNRFDNKAERFQFMLKNVIGQIKVLRVPGPGIAHALFFWGFLLLTIGTTLVFLQADILHPLLGIKFLKGAFYKLFSLTLDIAGLIAILMMIGLFVRRFFVKPEGLETSKDDYIMHGLLFAILITGFLIEGVRMAATELKVNPSLAVWSPIGLMVAKMFSGMNESSLLSLHIGLWWIHMFLAFGFIASIPYIKFRHIFTTSANYFFNDFRQKGSIDTIDLENEEAESFGVSKVNEFTWKDIFDSDACTKCKRCQDRCPAYNTGKPLSPMKLILDIGEAAVNGAETNVIEKISTDVIWSCTTCRACQEICPANNEHVNKIIEMRRNLVLMEGEFPGEEVMMAMNNVEVNGNPMGLGFASRGDWAEGLDVKVMSEDSDVDILYFVGCYASFDKRNQQVAKSFIKLCNAAGIKVGILGKEEKCCGEPVRKMGNEYLYQMVAMENIETIKSYNVKKIVTTCPHCFNTLGRDYKDLGFDIEVEHYTTFLRRLINDGKLKIKPVSFECTYHDSCYIGRYMDIFEEPREVLKAAGGNIKEMSKNRLESFCCGAGGGRIIAEESIGEKISVKRVKMAEETGANMLVSNCPFCLTMFEDGVKMAELDEKLKPRDLAELLVERLES